MKKFSIVLVLLAIFFSIGGVKQISADSIYFIKPAEGTVTSGFGMRWGKMHYGIDIAKSGTVEVKASYGGTVTSSYYSDSYGNVVFVRHNINGQTFETVYAHLRNRAVSVGDKVSRGQFLGYMGNTGNSSGQHLHFEVHKGTWNSSKSNAIDPIKVLNGDLDGNITPKYEVYHSKHGIMETFATETQAINYSKQWAHTAVIRISDGKQVYVNGSNPNNYSVYHSKHGKIANFAFDFNAIEFSKNWQHTVVVSEGNGKEIYVRDDLGGKRYEVYHSTNGYMANFTLLEVAKNFSNRWHHTVVININDGKQVYQNGLNPNNYSVYHSSHGKLADFSIRDNAIDYSNKWQHTVVINNGDGKQIYNRNDLGDYKYDVIHATQGKLASFHFLENAKGFSDRWLHTVVIRKSDGQEVYRNY